MSDPAVQYLRSSEIIFRNDFTDTSVLFDPATDKAFRINETGAFIWEILEKPATLEQLVQEIREKTSGDHASVEHEIRQFVERLVEKGLIGLVDEGSAQ